MATYAQGALANLRVYDPSPTADPELEEALRLRRLRDVVEAMQSRRATDKVQFYAKRWIERRRAAAKLQARMRGSIIRKQELQAAAERRTAATAVQARYRAHAARGQYVAERTALQQAQAQAAARLQARVRGVGVRAQPPPARDDDDDEPPTVDLTSPVEDTTPAAPTAKAAAPPPSATPATPPSSAAPLSVSGGQWVLVFGGAAASRQQLATELASRLHATLINLSTLITHAQRVPCDEGAAVLSVQQQKGLLSAALLVPLLTVFMRTHAKPFVVEGLFRMPNQLDEYASPVLTTNLP